MSNVWTEDRPAMLGSGKVGAGSGAKPRFGIGFFYPPLAVLLACFGPSLLLASLWLCWDLPMHPRLTVQQEEDVGWDSKGPSQLSEALQCSLGLSWTCGFPALHSRHIRSCLTSLHHLPCIWQSLRLSWAPLLSSRPLPLAMPSAGR